MSFARKNSNQASSSSIDSVVGCLHTLSLSLSHHTSNRKHESRDLQIIIRDYVVCHEHRNQFLISCGDVLWCCYSINSPADIELISDFSQGNEVAGLGDQRSVWGALSHRKHGIFNLRYLRTDLWSKGRPYLERNEELYIHMHMN